jgi:hypothetical protein
MPQCQSGRSSKSGKPRVRAMEMRFGSISRNGRLFQNVEVLRYHIKNHHLRNAVDASEEIT